MSIEDDHVALLKRAYEAWHDSKGAGGPSLDALFHKDLQFTSLANAAHEAVAFTAPVRGLQEYASYLDGLTRDWEMIFYRVDDYVAQGDRVVAIGSMSWKNKKTRKVVTTPKVDIFRFRGNKVAEFSEFYDTAQLIAAAISS